MTRVFMQFDRTTFNRWNFALAKVESMVKIQRNDNSYYNAVDFCFLVKHNILTQKYAATYPKFSDRYQVWKGLYGKGAGRVDYWNLFGNLLNAIKPTKLSLLGGRTVSGGGHTSWLGGVQPGAMSTGGQSWFGKGDRGEPKSIEMYGRKAEERRPLFVPTTNEYADDQWLRQGEKSLEKVGQSWS